MSRRRVPLTARGQAAVLLEATAELRRSWRRHPVYPPPRVVAAGTSLALAAIRRQADRRPLP